jgi:hypothetical protein
MGAMPISFKCGKFNLFSVKGLSVILTIFLFVLAIGLSDVLKKNRALPNADAHREALDLSAFHGSMPTFSPFNVATP